MSEYSAKRLESRIMESISMMISKGMIKNPKLSRFTSITSVDLSSDNAYATVTVSTVNERDLERSTEALNKASGFIQSHLGKILKTRNTPVLTFKSDRSYIEGERINSLIDKAMGRS